MNKRSFLEPVAGLCRELVEGDEDVSLVSFGGLYKYGLDNEPVSESTLFDCVSSEET